ncbi:hypothetical protein HanIR_Chr02g0070141 [Helianthus annuus]|nr:hypothetical protein HanIR_Chr02g0070141 [Helianthus annuus]
MQLGPSFDQEAMPFHPIKSQGAFFDLPQEFDKCTLEIAARYSINDPNGSTFPINIPPPFV